MPDQNTELANEPVGEKEGKYFGGAFGAGLVLVVLPCAALGLIAFGFSNRPLMELPILAIFGIMILFGALALVSTLFARLKLSDPGQALALPEGSIRAAIALALIVLFAIISIMLYQSSSKPEVTKIPGLGEPEMLSMVRNPVNHVIAVVPEPCSKPSTGGDKTTATPSTNSSAVTGPAKAISTDAGSAPEQCVPKDLRFSVHIRLAPAQESTDLAKQLLILIGTLMTSVTSFYFASRANEPKSQSESPGPAKRDNNVLDQVTQPVVPVAGRTGDESHMDACDVPIVNATPDEELPPAKGGVA